MLKHKDSLAFLFGINVLEYVFVKVGDSRRDIFCGGITHEEKGFGSDRYSKIDEMLQYYKSKGSEIIRLCDLLS